MPSLETLIRSKPLLTYFFLWLLFLYLGHFHEPWRDEAQAYMLAADSASLSEMLHNLRYEGHPPLWHLLLRLISKSGLSGPDALWITQATIAAGTATLWLILCPLNFPLRLLSLFSYFFLYEYGIIARTYSLACLLWMIALLAPPRPLRVAAALLVAFTSLYGWVLTLIYWLNLELQREGCLRTRLIFASNLALAAWLTIPSPQQDFFHPTYLSQLPRWSDLTTAITRFFSTLAPITFRWPYFWENHPHTQIPNLLFTLLFLIILTILLRKSSRNTKILLLTSLSIFLTISLCIYSGGYRHNGHWFLIILALMSRDRDWLRDNLRRWTLVTIMVLSMLGGVRHLIKDIRHPFSAAPLAAEIIREELKKNPSLQLVGGIDYTVSSIAYQLGRPIYYLNRGEFGTFVKWDRHRKRSPKDIHQDLQNWITKRNALFVFDTQFAQPFTPLLNSCCIHIATFHAAFVLDESYEIWTLKN
ncbi:MAG: hypothetical protein NZM04_04375 [Methylacidiphilales bacterium]|nr:hypothetical protein [Candidatus Methylacidiphilales bacterium]MDW8349698.1 hypothetical protein [Verrucomicrobiae bacterium]